VAIANPVIGDPNLAAGCAIAPIAEAAVADALRWCENKPRKEKHMEATEHGNSEKGELRARLEAATEKGKEVFKRLQEQTVAAAKTSDKVVREHPYQAIGIAFGVGLLVGVLAATRCRCE
jgi:ElaB/YqjD/DUF883 family membrane-anchored ribosome-binding protein